MSASNEFDVQPCVAGDQHVQASTNKSLLFEANLSHEYRCQLSWDQPHPSALSDLSRKAIEPIGVRCRPCVSDLSAQFAVHDGTGNRHVACRGRFVDDAREI